MTDEPLLAVRRASKRFTATLALDSVDFDVRGGEIHALLGQNGAGKSTLIKVLAGVFPLSAGTVLYRGQPVVPGSDPLPIAFIHQDLGLVDTMTVSENVAIQAGYPRHRGLIDWKGAREAARRALSAMGSTVDPETRVSTLSAADRSMVAIARALSVKCEILVLDEPTAALTVVDVERLLATLRELRAAGLGIIYVTHRLDEVFRIADRVTILRDGKCVATVGVRQTSSQDLIMKIVGQSVVTSEMITGTQDSAPLLTLRDVTVSHEDTGYIGPVSFALSAGEILALVGLRGAGHHTIGRALFAALPVNSGIVELTGRAICPRTPAAAMAAGIGFVSSRRGEESIAAAMSVRENLYVNPRARGLSSLMPVAPARELQAAARALGRFSVRPPDPTRPIITLSGGNQQKVVVARWMEAKIRLLILEEPTIGVDVGSKAEIYRDLQDALRNGMAVLLISSDFEEVEKIAHRALVFSRGQVVAQVPRPEITVSRLTALAAGGQEFQAI